MPVRPIDYCSVSFVLSILLISPALVVIDDASAQKITDDKEQKPDFTAVQYGDRTIILLATNWTVSSYHNEITLTSSHPIEKVLASDWWNVTEQSPNTVKLNLIENVYRTSRFMILSDTPEISYNYKMKVNSTSYSGEINPFVTGKNHTFTKWASGNENAATAFIPENWKADLQIIRPYDTMTGFVFFARDNENPNTMLYVFQPFVPMHIMPSDSLCQEEPAFCSNFGQGMLSVDKVKEISFGSAPLAISNLKDPDQYFTQEVLPILSKTLESYKVVSSSAASVAVEKNQEVYLMPSLDVDYSFKSKDKTVFGRAAIFTQNYTTSDNDEIGFWNGFVVGIESTEEKFDETTKNAVVTLLTLRFDQEWVDNEKSTLIKNAGDGNNTVTGLSKLIANRTLDDSGLFTEATARMFSQSDSDTKISGFIDESAGIQFDLPIYADLKKWFLSNDGKELVGRHSSSNMLGYSKLESLYI